MLVTSVVNVKRDLYDIYIGRPSKWGNPYKIEDHGNDREEVIKLYKAIVLPEFTDEELIKTFYGRKLGCWCAPEPCHGDVIVERVEQIYYERFG